MHQETTSRRQYPRPIDETELLSVQPCRMRIAAFEGVQHPPRRLGVQTVPMAIIHEVAGIDYTPIYVISAEEPWRISEDDFVDDVPLVELLGQLSPDEHLYFVDYASHPGQTRVTRLV